MVLMDEKEMDEFLGERCLVSENDFLQSRHLKRFGLKVTEYFSNTEEETSTFLLRYPLDSICSEEQ